MSERSNLRAYITGPLFNEEERYWNGEINSRMQKLGFTTYIPQRDGIKLQHQDDVRKIFEEDRKAVSQADVIVANKLVHSLDELEEYLQHFEADAKVAS